MNTYSFSHLSDARLLGALAELIARDRFATAVLLACIAEVDERKLYLPAAYPSMFAYCVHELRLSEDSAYKRIRAARTARRFPAIFTALADGRLNLTTIVLLTPHLTEQTADDLLAAATHKTKADIEQLLAQRFPQPELLGLVEAIPSAYVGGQLVPEPVEARTATDARGELAPEPVATPVPRSKVAPYSSGRFAIHATIGRRAHDDLRRAQELLGHELPSGDVGGVVERALRLLVRDLEKRKFAATDRPRQRPRPTTSARHVPAHVKRAVHARDGGQCTFVSDAGKRCASRTRLEFDHVDPVARGGEATVDNLRLRCRAHNQFVADCSFGPEFMSNKRQEARHAAEARKARKAQAAPAAAEYDDRDVKPWLRQLGYNDREARAAAAFVDDIPEAPLEQRLRAALSYFRPRGTTRGPAAAMDLAPAAPH